MATKVTKPKKEAVANNKAPAKSETKKPVGRPKGFQVRANDIITAGEGADERIAPQAQAIVNIVKSHPKGVKRKDLIEEMEGVVQTRQPMERIFAYYQKMLVEKGFLLVERVDPPETAETGDSEGNDSAED